MIAHPLNSCFSDGMARRRAWEGRGWGIELGRSGPDGVVRLWLRGGFSCRRRMLSTSPSSRLPQDVCVQVREKGKKKEGPEHSSMYLLEREERIQLDQAVEVAEEDGYRQEHEVTRIFAE